MCGESTIAFIKGTYKERYKMEREQDMKKEMTE